MGAPYADLSHPNFQRAVRGEINRTLSNLLASVRLLLDHTRTRLDRRYGSNSFQFASFERARQHALDSSPEYRIGTALRNFIQHVGLPFEGPDVTGSFDPVTETTSHTVHVK